MKSSKIDTKIVTGENIIPLTLNSNNKEILNTNASNKPNEQTNSIVNTNPSISQDRGDKNIKLTGKKITEDKVYKILKNGGMLDAYNCKYFESNVYI